MFEENPMALVQGSWGVGQQTGSTQTCNCSMVAMRVPESVVSRLLDRRNLVRFGKAIRSAIDNFILRRKKARNEDQTQESATRITGKRHRNAGRNAGLLVKVERSQLLVRHEVRLGGTHEQRVSEAERLALALITAHASPSSHALVDGDGLRREGEIAVSRDC